MKSKLKLKMTGLKTLGMGLACCAMFNVMAAPNEAEYHSAFEQFQKAANGDNSAIDGAAKSFNALLQTNPADPLVMAYAGAATSMRALDTFLPWKKLSYVDDGTALLDKALALLGPAQNAPSSNGVPVALETKFVAANTFIRLPGMFNRHERGVKLLDQVLNSPALATTSKNFRGSVWMLAANDAVNDKRAADAKGYFSKVIEIDAPQAVQAKEKMKELQ
jgi:hypothetical protein